MGDLLTALEVECRHQRLAFGLRLKFASSSASIYEATSTERGHPKVLIKVSLLAADHSQTIEREMGHLEALTHENILKVFAWRYLRHSAGTYFYLIQEFAETNLAEEIEKRRSEGRRFEEEELFKMISDLLSALLHMKQQQIAHRNINPFNIFLSGVVPKLGNFDYLKAQVEDVDQTASLTGYHVYWSPSIREAALAQQQYHIHNIYKSDMYSLGLTILAMTGLYDTESMRTLISASVATIIEQLNYSQMIKDLLSGMLRENEGERLSFEDAKQEIDRSREIEFSISLGSVVQPPADGTERSNSYIPDQSPSGSGGISGAIVFRCDLCKANKSIPEFKFPGCDHGLCSYDCKYTLHLQVMRYGGGSYQCTQDQVVVPLSYFGNAPESRPASRRISNPRSDIVAPPQPYCICKLGEISMSCKTCTLF